MGMRVWNQCNTLIIAILYDKKNASNFKIKHSKRLEYLLVSCFDKRKSSDMTTTSAILLHILSIIYHIILCDSVSCNIRVSIEKIWFEYNKYPILSYPILSHPVHLFCTPNNLPPILLSYISLLSAQITLIAKIAV